jgi:hypothetical protein
MKSTLVRGCKRSTFTAKMLFQHDLHIAERDSTFLQMISLIHNDGYRSGTKNVQPNIQRGKSYTAVQEKMLQ